MNDFDKLIIQGALDHKPGHNYQKMNAPQLLYCLAMLRATGREYVARIIFTERPDAPLQEVASVAADMSHHPTPQVLAKLHGICQDMKSLKDLVEIRFEQEEIYAEVGDRLKKSRVGMETLRHLGRKAKPTTLNDLYKVLKVDTMRTYKPEKETDEELRIRAVEGLWPRFEKLGQSLKVSLPSASFPPLTRLPDIPGGQNEDWQLLNFKMLERDFEKMQETVLPALQGEKLRESARQALKDYWEMREAQKREGEEVVLDDVRKEITSKTYKEWLNKEQLEEEATPASPDISAKMWEVLREAKKHKRWGPQFIRFCKYYLQGYPEKEAAKLAGGTDRTARNDITRLKKNLLFQEINFPLFPPFFPLVYVGGENDHCPY